MASWVLSDCGLKPLPRIYPNPRTGLASSTTTVSGRIRPFQSCRKQTLGPSRKALSGSRERNWALNVSTPVKSPSLGEEAQEENGINGLSEESSQFDPSAPPPFNLADIRAAIPKHCWVKDPWRSMSYVVRDVAVVFALAAVAAYFNNWVAWPLYWFAQGTMFWALFVLGHDW